MNSPRPSSIHVTDIFAVVARCLLGAVFLYTGMSKALEPVEFLKLLRQYDLTHHSFLLNSIAVTLPWFEVFCGLLLLAGIAVRGTSLLLLLMLIPFTLLVLHRALAVQSAMSIPFCAVKFDCGCGTGSVFICRKLVENVLLALLAGWLLTGAGQRFCLRPGLLKSK